MFLLYCLQHRRTVTRNEETKHIEVSLCIFHRRVYGGYARYSCRRLGTDNVEKVGSINAIIHFSIEFRQYSCLISH